MNFAEMRLEEGQQVTVTSSTGKYYGKFNKLSMNDCRMEIVEVKDEDGKPCGRFKFFYSKDVVEVEFGDNTSKKENKFNEQIELMRKQQSEAQSQNDLQEGCSNENVRTEDRSKSISKLSNKQIVFIYKTIQHSVLFNRIDASYVAALEDISKNFTIGLSVAGIDMSSR
jgi:hypothetical protein